MKVLITGSGGFVGSEVRALLAQKHTIIDYNMSDGDNILNSAELEQRMQGVDAVVHLAGITDTTSPDLWEVNVKGTKNVLEAAIKNHVKKFVYLSSTGVYGSPSGAVNEKSETHPENNYEKSKLEGECLVLAQQEQLVVAIVRSAMVFGNNNYWKGMVALLKKSYPLPGSGENYFQVIYTKELARAIALVLQKGKSGEIYLAAGSEKITLNTFCARMKKELGATDTRMRHVPAFLAILFGAVTGSKTLTAENIRHLNKERNYTLTKIHKLGYKEKYSLATAIKKVVGEMTRIQKK